MIIKILIKLIIDDNVFWEKYIFYVEMKKNIVFRNSRE